MCIFCVCMCVRVYACVCVCVRVTDLDEIYTKYYIYTNNTQIGCILFTIKFAKRWSWKAQKPNRSNSKSLVFKSKLHNVFIT